MSIPVCWLFFDPVLLPGDPAVFAGHCHDIEYIGDCPMGGYLVGCNACLVDQSAHTLTYDTNVLPPEQDGVVITPLSGFARVNLTETKENFYGPPHVITSLPINIPKRKKGKPAARSRANSATSEDDLVVIKMTEQKA
jgi:hypothetical protein